MLAFAPSWAPAGGGPENVLLVVNANSGRSKEIANHYVRLRDLPAANVLYLDYKGQREQERGEVFREQILGPVVEAINQRGLAAQVDLIAYSSDFPWRILLAGDYPDEVKLPKQARPIASITGATYLYQYVLSKSPAVVSYDTNRYLAPSPVGNTGRCVRLGETPSRAFRSRYRWGEGGVKTKSDKTGQRYLMASMLGVNTGRGNTVKEVIDCLKRAAYADVSPPTGTFYFLRNNDIRSVTRHACYAEAVDALRGMGASAKIQQGVVPKGAGDVAGLTLGKDNLGLADAQMTIQPGAFCEHLTSAGGLLFKMSFQTPLTDLLRAGATASCGAVEEPYAIQAKFPLPSLQVHYRRGCSMAEAYYQSVAAPYQLLLVGDPLCQPWAKRPQLHVDGWPASTDPFKLEIPGFEARPETPAPTDRPAEAAVKTAEAEAEDEDTLLSLTPRVTPNGAKGVAMWELFVDGKLRMRLPSGTAFKLTSEHLGPGWRELRCVAMNPDPLEGQQRLVTTVRAPRPAIGGEVPGQVTIESEQAVAPIDGVVRLKVSAPGAERIKIMQNLREVASVDGPSGVAQAPARLLGKGPVRLRAVAEPDGAASQAVWIAVE